MQSHSDRTTWTFGQTLDWHLQRGTRPDGTTTSKGIPWGNKDFAKSVGAVGREGPKSERTIRNWRNGDTAPNPSDFHAIRLALFGGSNGYDEWRSELTDKYHVAQGSEKGEPEASQPSSGKSLPQKPLRCVGRDEDVRLVAEALASGQSPTAVLVLGGPGMGKTTLTRQAANDPIVVERFSSRRWFVELETAKDLEDFEIEIVRTLGLDPKSAKLDSAVEFLGRSGGLLILDNLETPWEAEPSGIEQRLAQLATIPDLALLASIRGSEAPAKPRWTRRRTMEPLEEPHDRELLLDIAGNVGSDDPDLGSLLEALGGIPLAIELVAMQADSGGTLRAVLEEWRRVGSALAQRPRLASSRLTSLDISLELSFVSPRLGDAGRRLFSFLGQSPAGICVDDLQALLGQQAFDARRGLLSCGLGFERNGRLDLLPPVRHHAKRLHAPVGGDVALWRDHYLALASSQGRQIGRIAIALHRVAAEIPNLENAICSALDANDLAKCLKALRGFALTVEWTGTGTGALIHRMAAACASMSNIVGEANCIESLGDIALARSDHDAARKSYEQALTLYRQVDSIQGEANCIQGLGDTALARSDHDAARESYEQALPLYRQFGSVLGEANCIQSLGDIALRRSDHDAARRNFEQALPLYRQVGDVLGEANCIRCLGDIALACSDHDAARSNYEQALLLYRQVGDLLGEANCVQGLGDIALRRSDHDAARKSYEHALSLNRQVGDLLGEANCIRSLGDIALARSDHDAARKNYEQALPLYRQVGSILGEANCIRSLGEIVLRRFGRDAARKNYEQALILFQQVGSIVGEANCVRSLGDVELARSDHDAGCKNYEQALLLYRQVGSILGQANCIQSLGDVALRRSDHGAARKNYEQALLLYRQVGSILGQANCIQGLGNIALAGSDLDAARKNYEQALSFFEKIPEPYSIGMAHRRLAEISKGEEQSQHLNAARDAWLSIDRPDLVATLDKYK